MHFTRKNSQPLSMRKLSATKQGTTRLVKFVNKGPTLAGKFVYCCLLYAMPQETFVHWL